MDANFFLVCSLAYFVFSTWILRQGIKANPDYTEVLKRIGSTPEEHFKEPAFTATCSLVAVVDTMLFMIVTAFMLFIIHTIWPNNELRTPCLFATIGSFISSFYRHVKGDG